MAGTHPGGTPQALGIEGRPREGRRHSAKASLDEKLGPNVSSGTQGETARNAKSRDFVGKLPMKQRATHNAPAHLRPDTKAWWLSVHQEYDLAEHHVRLLTLAAEAFDRACEAREILARDGIVIGGREAAVRPHPAVAIERDARIAFARLIAQLNLDVDSPVDSSMRAAQRSARPGGWRGHGPAS